MRPILFRYHSVSECLTALRADHAAKHPDETTYEKLGEKLGLRSRTQAKRLFKGDLKISRSLMESIARTFELTSEEAGYMDLLRRFEEAQNSEQAFLLFQKINAERARTLGEQSSHVLGAQEIRILDHWFVFPVLHYFELNGHATEAAEISRHFAGKISPTEVSLAIQTLLEAKLLERRPDGGLRKVHEFISLLDGLPRPLVRKYHQMMIERSLESVFGVPQEKRFLMAATIPTNPSLVPLIKARISDFLMKLNEEFSTADPETLYQVNLQLLHMASTQASSSAPTQ
jgi:uncharacterized protein (TIGR02147 family)